MILVFVLILMSSCEHRRANTLDEPDSNSNLTWASAFPNLGTHSSPRTADLNQDGVLDIIVGMGRLEFQPIDTAIVALDGKTGDVLWNRPAIDQIFGSALLMDITGDDIEDIIIGGRSATLQAMDGATGALIWEFSQHIDKSLIQVKYFNFYNPQSIPDQNNDGIPEILVSNGGDVRKAPYDEDRPVGRLIILDGSNGKIIQEAEMPDGKETYYSVTLSSGENTKDIELTFGTGGETVSGSLYVCRLQDVLDGDLSNSTQLVSRRAKGFIAPSVWVDLNGDGIADIVANSVDGNVFAFDGQSKKELWQTNIYGAEIYTMPAVGHFLEEGKLDVFVVGNSGVWPSFFENKNVLIDGQTGEIKFNEPLGNFQTSSPLIVDADGDGTEEILLSVNKEEADEAGKKFFSNSVFLIDFTENQNTALIPFLPGHNNSSTPWIGDLDGDRMLDIVFCHSTNSARTYAFDDMQVNLLKTKIPITQPITWGAYMGSRYMGRE
ncbi:PQQ-binding-like beta-propeller repeat protein [Pararhodonellum marinum]|uniref:PQQ-binding-like beta-propeller repeat protein n=1 Tax=Pararhodonellum marinum TaxID=2755358 RepID=UPI00189027AA|nr:PQQ-binding-like beta-propeller repeat protein [Pararhodonellum marinum]